MATSRLRLKDLLESRLPEAIGRCSGDVAQVAAAVNSAQERLLTCREAGEHGWYGSYAELALTATSATPRVVLPRGVARLISVTACDTPIPIWNQFFEYLSFGSGHWPKLTCESTENVCQIKPVVSIRRNTTPTFRELTTPGYGLRFYSSAADDGKRILVGCKDANDQQVFTLDGPAQVNGCFATFTAPFVSLMLPGTAVPLELSEILGIQKDITIEPVYVYEVNLTTGAQTLILTMEPGETVAAYAAYYFNALPDGCCPTGDDDTVQLLAMVKLDLIPAVVATDYLLIQSKEAIIAEAQAARFEDMDSRDAKVQAASRHRDAVRYLQGQLVHFEGKESVAVSFAPFGRSRLANQRIGLIL